MRASSEVFASRNMRESPREETGMFYFHACITGFACHFLTLREERDFCARERLLFLYIHREIDFKESPDGAKGLSFSTPRGSRDANARVYTRCPRRCVSFPD